MFLDHHYLSTRSKNVAGLGAVRAKNVVLQKVLAHVKYIQHRPGIDKEKGGRMFFDSDRDEVSGREIRALIRNEGGKHLTVHKITMSPDVEVDDPRDYVREVLSKLAQDKGLDLSSRWFGIVHQNTDNYHVHMILLGKDNNGRQVFLKKDDHHSMRQTADYWLDRNYPVERFEKELERRQAEIEKSREKEKRLLAKQLEREKQVEDKDVAKQAWLDRHKLSALQRQAIRRMYPHAMDKQLEERQLQELFRETDTIVFHGIKYNYSSDFEQLKSFRQFLKDHPGVAKELGSYNVGNIDKWLELKRSELLDKRLDKSQTSQLKYGSGVPAGADGLWVEQAASGSFSAGGSTMQLPLGYLIKADAPPPKPETPKATLPDKLLSEVGNESVKGDPLTQKLNWLDQKFKLMSAVQVQSKTSPGMKPKSQILDDLQDARANAEKQLQARNEAEKQKSKEVEPPIDELLDLD